MVEAGAGLFWSYAHEDDVLDEGRVLGLATRLQQEYALLTGAKLDLFVDRSSIEWGDEWRVRIDNALTQTTFFIPVVTPRYFTRPECRKELLAFAGQAESLGVRELVLPILYVAVPDLRDDNPDEAVALVARMHYIDWTQLRVVGPESRDYRKGVNALALRLVDLTTSVSERQAEQEAAAEDGGPDSPGLIEVVERIHGLLPEWLRVVQEDPITEAQHMATFSAMTKGFRKYGARGLPGQQRFC